MKIYVHRGALKIKLLFSARMAACIAFRSVKSQMKKRGLNFNLTRQNKREVVKAVKAAKREFKSLTLVSVETQDKTQVRITL